MFNFLRRPKEAKIGFIVNIVCDNAINGEVIDHSNIVYRSEVQANALAAHMRRLSDRTDLDYRVVPILIKD